MFGGFVIRHRLIPAYAGSTVEFPLFRCLPGAHPRLRGEHGLAPVYTGNTLGSSPLTRGAPARKVPPARAHGLIPAYAGSTTTARIYAAGLGAHPRLRGEHTGRLQKNGYSNGSSPLTRGAHGSVNTSDSAVGLIPAYAGSTRLRPGGRVPIAAHPRLRGEHKVTSSDMRAAVGSSPLTRGALARCPCNRIEHGLIPAYAGSTLSVTRPSTVGRAHPRLRGEHSDSCANAVGAVGSSPLTRGARLRVLTKGHRNRLIPAYAGSTGAAGGVGSGVEAHPRLRGEHLFGGFAGAAHWGSSPLTRGALADSLPEPMQARLIPAYAGSTKPDEEFSPPVSAHPRLRGEHTC